jgi:hypothetical protein
MSSSFTEAALAAYAKLAKDKYAEKHRRVQGAEHLDNGAIDDSPGGLYEGQRSVGGRGEG